MPALPAHEWFKYAAASQELMLAVAAVFEKMKSDLQKPASEKWLISSTSFKLILRKVKIRWSELSKLEYSCFPFSKTFVRWAWLTYRKDGEGVILAWAKGSRPALFH